MLMRFHTQTAGCSLTSQEPYNNVVRTTMEALAAVLGGTQSLHTNSLDEVYMIPSEQAALIALRTQQIIAYETGVTTTIDPLGGSYFVEDLTNRMEAEAERYFEEIDRRGGVLACIEEGFFQREIADAAFRYQQELDAGERIVVGVNAYQAGDDAPPPLLRIDQTAEGEQKGELEALRRRRDGQGVGTTLDALRAAAAGDTNLMLPILDCVRALCTEGEIVQAMQDVFGTYRESPTF
jgi:methylmalonyl-CoA mutase N-terminal domain/subunit